MRSPPSDYRRCKTRKDTRAGEATLRSEEGRFHHRRHEHLWNFRLVTDQQDSRHTHIISADVSGAFSGLQFSAGTKAALRAVVEALHLAVIRRECAEMKDHQGEHTFTNEHHYSLHIQ